MKYKFLCILLIVSVIFGCGMKSQIKDSLRRCSGANQYTTVTIFPIHPEAKEFAECIQKELKEDLQYLKFFPGDKFREVMFPWFEPNTAPKYTEELSALLSKTLIKNHIESLGVELLIYVNAYTKKIDEDGDFIIIGVFYTDERETHIQTTVWDLKEIVRVGDTDISFKGTEFFVLTFIPPFLIPVPTFTDRSACKETAKRISNCLTGKDSITNK
jgi:hypothetical protein